MDMLQRVARKETHDRLTIMRVHVVASVVLLASTLVAWENHPRVKFRGGAHRGYFVSEVSHSIGLATRPAGLLILGVAVLSLAMANLLRKVHLHAGWLAFLLS
jgi:hydrogenase-4 membrane subunit HyfE